MSTQLYERLVHDLRSALNDEIPTELIEKAVKSVDDLFANGYEWAEVFAIDKLADLVEQYMKEKEDMKLPTKEIKTIPAPTPIESIRDTFSDLCWDEDGNDHADLSQEIAEAVYEGYVKDLLEEIDGLKHTITTLQEELEQLQRRGGYE